MNGRTIDVLMIEDDPEDAYIIESLLKGSSSASEPLHLERSCCIEDGLHHLAVRQVDSLLLDLNLPDSSGAETVSRIRRTSPVPIVVFTSSDEIEVVTRVLQAGAQEYLVKGEATGSCLWRAIHSSIERLGLRGDQQEGIPKPSPGPTIFAFGDFELEMDQRELRWKGRAVPIHLKPMALLHYLIRHRERVVSKDEVLEEVWSGLMVSDAALSSALKDLRHALGDDAAHQRFIRTLRGFGYQFVAPVAESGSADATRVRSLAVLPFDNLSTDPKVGHLAIGVTESLIGELVGVKTLRLVSSDSAAQFLTSSESLPELARQQGVDFVLRGSVAQAGNRTRVAVRLLDAHGDRYAWAGHYEWTSDDIFVLQSDLARTVARQLCVELADA